MHHFHLKDQGRNCVKMTSLVVSLHPAGARSFVSAIVRVQVVHGEHSFAKGGGSEECFPAESYRAFSQNDIRHMAHVKCTATLRACTRSSL